MRARTCCLMLEHPLKPLTGQTPLRKGIPPACKIGCAAQLVVIWAAVHRRHGHWCVSDEQYVGTTLSYHLSEEEFRDEITGDLALALATSGIGFSEEVVSASGLRPQSTVNLDMILPICCTCWMLHSEACLCSVQLMHALGCCTLRLHALPFSCRACC